MRAVRRDSQRRLRILLIGGTRFIGPYVVRRLARNGQDVAVFHRGEHDPPLPARIVRFKSPDAQIPVIRIPEELRTYAPDVVVHMIAMGERDAAAARDAFAGVAKRLVVLSSGDVYRAYGIFRRIEEGAPERVPLHESSPLRSRLYPYRSAATPPNALEFYYDKVLVERTIAADARLPTTILRLPKVYGPGDRNAALSTVYDFRAYPQWRWTHGFVENVAQAIVLATENEAASGRIYNVGEETTPTIAERLRYLPATPHTAVPAQTENFAQDIVYDTAAIRSELGYREEIPERDAMRDMCLSAPGTGAG
jgi:nucleoside-diphosphate-sugar epimerase